MNSSLIFAGLLAFALTACTNTNKDKPISESGPTSGDIFSNRPIGVVPQLFIVTLQSPALLKAAQVTPGGVQIPESAKQAVLQEQLQFEQKLKSVAPQAQVVYRYRLVLNGVAVYAPTDLVPSISALAGVTNVNPVRQMSRPETTRILEGPRLTSSTTSVSFIGADIAHQMGITGRNMKVGVLDTGVDYTHSMLGGSGKPEDFKAIDPAAASPMFPNAKVVGGIDLVGTNFNAASSLAIQHLPIPDANPIDEAGHGTHVAGTVAGIGNGTTTYSGVAPDAVVHAIKVFGKGGSTMDAVVIAGFEYSADPNGDLDLSDRLDVINLSLGGGFGQPQILYTEASRNLTRAGTVIVASAGNSGPIDYIVGAPSTSDDALSVAASVDGMPHNWQFPAVRFSSASATWLSKAVEGPVSKPIEQIGSTAGDLVYIGLGDTDFTDEQKAELQGKVALAMRGKVPFSEKIRRAAEAGAVGAVIINNEPGNRAFAMGGEGKFDIPAVMIGNDMGQKILADLPAGPIRIEFKTAEKIFEPENIDTITDFSSKGPRSEDNLLKPEIAAPGQSIISAAMGGGTVGVGMSGTSMAAPHMAGVMALLKQARPELSALDLKALVMDTAKVLPGIPMTLQGAGRVQVDQAIKGSLLVSPSALSLGRVQVGTSRKLIRPVTIKNISTAELKLNLDVQSTRGLRLTTPGEVTVPAGSTIIIQVEAEVSIGNPSQAASELEGRVFFRDDKKIVAQLPALAIATQASMVQGQAPGPDKLSLTNSSPVGGLALAFNLIGEDPRKAEPLPNEAWKSRTCDLQSAGYRIVNQAGPSGPEPVLQIAFKLHTPMTTWIQCEVAALIDSNSDGVADQELAGTFGGQVEGFAQGRFASLLLDATKARSLRLAYEAELSAGKDNASVDYSEAILNAADMAAFPHSTVAVIEAPLRLVAKTPDGAISVKVAAMGGGGDMIEADDYLGPVALGGWLRIAGQPEAQSFIDLPELVSLEGSKQSVLTYRRGQGNEKLVIYYPNNELQLNGVDSQSQVF